MGYYRGATYVSYLTPLENRFLYDFQKELMRKLKIVPEKISVFGSRAKGQSGEGSDLDIAVYLPTSPDQEVKKAAFDIAWSVAEQIGVAGDIPIQIVTLFNNERNTFFASEIAKNEEVIWLSK